MWSSWAIKLESSHRFPPPQVNTTASKSSWPSCAVLGHSQTGHCRSISSKEQRIKIINMNGGNPNPNSLTQIQWKSAVSRSSCCSRRGAIPLFIGAALFSPTPSQLPGLPLLWSLAVEHCVKSAHLGNHINNKQYCMHIFITKSLFT